MERGRGFQVLGKGLGWVLGLVLAASFAAGPVEASVRGPPVFACVANAPVETDCTSGTNSNGNWGIIGVQDECLTGCLRHGVDGLGYVGIVESHLVWAGGERVFSCTFTDATSAVTASCTGYGTFPPTGAAFTQVCTSRDLATGLPGGAGVFGCHMIHS